MTDRLIAKAQTILPNIPLAVVSQGAEALVFQTSVHPYSTEKNDQYIIKYRPSKPYRHPKIDAQITKTRTAGEAKFMHKLAKLGIKAPTLLLVDFDNGIIWMSHLGTKLPNGETSTLKNWLWYLERTGDRDLCLSTEVEQKLGKVGEIIARLHLNNMTHGDLTSSNLILVDSEPALIDFGLSSFTTLIEDKAVDLYLLERAIESTHGRYGDKWGEWIMQGYKALYLTNEFRGKKAELDSIMRRLDDIQLRGRKRGAAGL